MKRTTGFTLVELLVVITIIALLAGIVLPSLGRAKELARRQVCLGNIKAMIIGMRGYATSNENQHFPCDSPTISGTSCIGLNQNQRSYNADETDHGGSVTSQAGTSRSLFLLARGNHVGLKAFVCPSARDHAVNEETDPYVDFDFATEQEVSYSTQVQKRDQAGTVGFITSLLDEPELAVLADRNPISGIDGWTAQGSGRVASPDAGQDKRSGLDEAIYNSFNHRQDGQMVGYVNGRVKWLRNPKVGMLGQDVNKGRDNIWCPQDSSGNDEVNASIGNAYPRRFLQHESQRDSLLWP